MIGQLFQIGITEQLDDGVHHRVLTRARFEVLELLQQIALLLACEIGPFLILAVACGAVAGKALCSNGGSGLHTFGQLVLIGGNAAGSRLCGGCGQSKQGERQRALDGME